MLQMTITSGGPTILHGDHHYSPRNDYNLGKNLCLAAISKGFHVDHWMFQDSSQPPLPEVFEDFYKNYTFTYAREMFSKFEGHCFGLSHCIILGHLYTPIREITKGVIDEIRKNRPDIPLVVMLVGETIDPNEIEEIQELAPDVVIHAGYEQKRHLLGCRRFLVFNVSVMPDTNLILPAGLDVCQPHDLAVDLACQLVKLRFIK